MGYFSNGTEGMDYQEQYCFKCRNWSDEKGCAVWNAHEFRNYKEANNPDSILHDLSPRSKDGLGNEKCLMYLKKGAYERKHKEPSKQITFVAEEG